MKSILKSFQFAGAAIVLLLASMLFASNPAQAQSTEVVGTPRAVAVNGDTVAIWAADTSLGSCLILSSRPAGGAQWYVFTGPIGCGVSQSTFNDHGTAAGWIIWLLPDINRTLAAHYGPIVATSILGQINSALVAGFQMRLENGAVVLSPK